MFQYLPLRDSPNDNPHVELALQPGELLIVHGPMDEDRFYWGETLNGRAGLVPSNFVQRVPDQEMAKLINVEAENAGSDVIINGSSSQSDNTQQQQLLHLHCPAVASTSSAVVVTAFPSASSSSSQDQQQMYSGIVINNNTSRAESPSFALAVPTHLTQIDHDFSDSSALNTAAAAGVSGEQQQRQPPTSMGMAAAAIGYDQQQQHFPDSICPYPPVDVSKVTVQEIKNMDQARVACPRELQVERRLSRSLLISWLPPESSGAGGSTSTAIGTNLLHKQAVSQYQICVNGQVRAVVPGSFKCRALLEDLELNKFVNVSVRAVAADGMASPDAGCTLAVGNEAPVAPQHLRVNAVTPTSAQFNWYPSNSEAEHVVLLNAVKVGVCPPTVFQVQLNGLCPSNIYRLSVRTKHPRAVLEKRPVERCVDFKTMPKIGLPDPPADVQAEPGPQPGTLLLSWRPNSAQPRPPSRAAVHSYLIYADGRCIAQVPGSTADHVLLRLADFAEDPPVFITVRTRTKEGAVSADSNVVRVPRGTTSGNAGDADVIASGMMVERRQQQTLGTTNSVLLSSSLPNNLLGQLMLNNSSNIISGGAASSNQFAAVAAIPPPQLLNNPSSITLPPFATSSSQQQPAAIPAQQQQQPSVLHHLSQHQQQYHSHPHLLMPAIANTSSGSTEIPPEQNGGISCWELHNPPGGGALSSLIWPVQQQQQQYFTFHPKALHKEYPRMDERPDLLAMEQNYLLRHQQRQRIRSATPERRSIPQHSAKQQQQVPARAAFILPGAKQQQQPSHSQFSDGLQLPRPTAALTALPPYQTARLRHEWSGGTRSEPDLRPSRVPGVEDSRWFVAILDHQPGLIAPDELPFRRHQLVKVFGDVDGNGCFWAEVRGRFGLVPAGKLVEIAKDDLFIAAKERRPAMENILAAGGREGAPMMMAGWQQQQQQSTNLRRMRWGSIKSRSYEHTTDGTRQLRQQQQQRASFVASGGGSTRLLPDEQSEKNWPSTMAFCNSWTAEGGGRGEMGGGVMLEMIPDGSRPMMKQQQRRMSAVETNGGGENVTGRKQLQQQQSARKPIMREMEEQRSAGGGTGYRLPTVNDARTIGGGARGEMPGWKQLRNLPADEEENNESLLMGEMGREGDETTEDGMPGIGGQEEGGGGDDLQQQQAPTLHGLQTQLMQAKYDYDSRQLSPNVDAEQVELSFRQGDLITVYGPMDEDGFYLGELNGVRGLVPSNFFQPAAQPSAPPSEPIVTTPSSTMPNSSNIRPKGVAFSSNVAVTANNTKASSAGSIGWQQQNSTSVAAKLTGKKTTGGNVPILTGPRLGGGASTGASGMTSKAYKVAGIAQAAGGANKALTKKSSDMGIMKTMQSANRKTSQALKVTGQGGGTTKKKG